MTRSQLQIFWNCQLEPKMNEGITEDADSWLMEVPKCSLRLYLGNVSEGLSGKDHFIHFLCYCAFQELFGGNSIDFCLILLLFGKETGNLSLKNECYSSRSSDEPPEQVHWYVGSYIWPVGRLHYFTLSAGSSNLK